MLPGSPPVAVAPTSVGADQELVGVRVGERAIVAPPAAEAFDGEGGGLVVLTHIDPAHVSLDVVDARRGIALPCSVTKSWMFTGTGSPFGLPLPAPILELAAVRERLVAIQGLVGQDHCRGRAHRPATRSWARTGTREIGPTGGANGQLGWVSDGERQLPGPRWGGVGSPAGEIRGWSQEASQFGAAGVPIRPMRRIADRRRAGYSAGGRSSRARRRSPAQPEGRG